MYMIIDDIKKRYVKDWEFYDASQKISTIYTTENAFYGLLFSSKKDAHRVVEKFKEKERYRVITI